LVIPREGVESPPEDGPPHALGEAVIPREGVESRVEDAHHRVVDLIVIPREGVESRRMKHIFDAGKAVR
jgi:hypothetical protein